ncbi:MAG: acyltransferase [Bacteroidetes bacterium]|nr:MAG: acyltransferase [Bacteroidota bacterium]
MSRFCRYFINKSYTICQSILGMKTAKGSMIHCSSDIRYRKNIYIGEKSILYKKQSLYIGRNGKMTLGKNSHAAPYGYFLIENQKLTIGDDVAIGPYCSFFCSSNTYSPDKALFRENYEKADIKIGNNVFIGAQSVILPGSVIHNHVIVAANSVVRGILESGWLYGGSPCKQIKKLDKND